MINTYCIWFDDKETEVFYFERGIKFDLEIFSKKDDAIEYFYNIIMSDQTTRKDWNGEIK